MKSYRCPVCRKPLSKTEFEKALHVHEGREKHFKEKEDQWKKKLEDSRTQQRKAIEDVRQKEKAKGERQVEKLKDTEKKLREQLRQRQKGTTPQTEGLEFEEKLTNRLKKEFSEDEIQHKGQGGDVLQFVKFSNQQAGVIIYECKRTPAIQSSYIRQTYLAKQTRHADFAVLVTTGKKRGFSGFAQMGGVLVVAPLGVIPLATLLRSHLIEMLRSKVTKEKRAIIAQKLLTFITDPQFKNPLEEVIQLGDDLQHLLKDEMKDHARIWTSRWKHYQTIKWNNSLVQDNIQLVLHGQEPKLISNPKLEPLLLPDAKKK